MIQLYNHRHRSLVSQPGQHLAKNRQRGMSPTAGPGLQYDRDLFSLGSGHEGPHVLPAESDQPRNRMFVLQGGLQHFSQGYLCHYLNLAIMSFMPGIVSI